MIPYYQDELTTLHCGNCAKVMGDVLPNDSIDLTVTSPPYDNLRDYNGYTFDFEAIANQLWRVTKPGGVVVWVVADQTKDGCESLTSFRQALYFNQLGFNVETMIFYKAGNGAAGSHCYYWQEFEYMFIFSKGNPVNGKLIRDRKNKKGGGKNSRKRRGDKKRIEQWANRTYSKRGNVWQYDTGMNCGTTDDTGTHTAFFPEALARDHIISWSNPGDIVFDPMCGSGTTLKMAAILGRKSIGIEISSEYCDIAVQRIQTARAATGKPHTVTVAGSKWQQGSLLE